MSKEATFDPDYLHGVMREFYIRRLVAGGAKRERLQMPPHLVDRHCAQYSVTLRTLLEVLADRGDLDPAKLRPTDEDKIRAPVPDETDTIKPVKAPAPKVQKPEQLKTAVLDEALPAPTAPVISVPRVRERTRSRS